MPDTLGSLNSGSSNYQENITFLRPLYFLAAKNPLVGHPSIMHQSGFFPFVLLPPFLFRQMFVGSDFHPIPLLLLTGISGKAELCWRPLNEPPLGSETSLVCPFAQEADTAWYTDKGVHSLGDFKLFFPRRKENKKKWELSRELIGDNFLKKPCKKRCKNAATFFI